MYKYNYLISDSKRSQKYNDLFLKKIPNNWILDKNDYEFLFVIGGDGTLFRSSKFFIEKKCKVILINGGNFGFFSSFDEKNIVNIFQEILDENHYINPQIISVAINDQKFDAINDIYIASFSAASIDVFINDQYYEKFKGTGFVFSTPLGSSAWNKSAGGAVIIDDVDCYQMNEIQPVRQIHFNTLGSPLILSGTSTVKLKILEKEINYYCLIDGLEIKVENLDELIISYKRAPFFLYNPNDQRIHKIKKAFIKGD